MNIYYILIFGILWAPLFTILYWQYGEHKELDGIIRNRDEKTKYQKLVKLILLLLFGISEKWLISVLCLVFLLIFKIIGV